MKGRVAGAGRPPEAHRKTKVGRVVSDKMDKTVVVNVERLRRHPIYHRVVRLTTKFKAHDPENVARVGDTVRIEETRPMSAHKRWRLVEVLGHVSAEEIPGGIAAELADEATDRPVRVPAADRTPNAAEQESVEQA